MLEYSIVFSNSLSITQKEDILNLLVVANDEFIPPLSHRSNTLQQRFHAPKSETAVPTEYYNSLMDQCFLLALHNDSVIGFMSYIPDHSINCGKGKKISAHYVSTVIIHPEFRSLGITAQLYAHLMKLNKKIATRTWSTNFAHIHILKKLKFTDILTIKDDRGKGIDTIYFCKDPLEEDPE